MRKRSRNPFWHRRKHRRVNGRRRMFNPSGLVSSLTSGFNVNTLKMAGVLVAGGLANAMLSNQIINLVPVDMLKSKPGYYVPRLLSAGLLSG